MNSRIRIAFTAGGSGGHVFPLFAVLEGIKKISIGENVDVEVRYFGPEDNSMRYVKQFGLPISKIIGGNGALVGFFKNCIGFIQALWFLLWYMPDVVFSKGSYGALPVILAAKVYFIPVVIHESDSVPGKSNLFSARFAEKILVSFEYSKQYFAEKKVVMVGNPVRPRLLEPISQEEAKTLLGFKPEKQLVLVLGGSQGAVAINEFILDLAPQLLQKVQVLHQVGGTNYDTMRSEVAAAIDLFGIKNKEEYKIVDFLEGEEYRQALYAADLIISRAGAGGIFEIATAQKPSILIPIAGLANDHQVFNAQEYAQYGGAEIFEQSNLLPHLFLDRTFRILDNPDVMAKMVEGAKRFAAPQAAEQIAREILLVAVSH